MDRHYENHVLMYGFTVAVSVLFGALLSLLYFGGLWVTLHRARHLRRMKLVLLASFVVRTVLVLAGFYLVIRLMGDRWEMVGLTLLGFLVGRFALVRRWRPDADAASSELRIDIHGN